MDAVELLIYLPVAVVALVRAVIVIAVLARIWFLVT